MSEYGFMHCRLSGVPSRQIFVYNGAIYGSEEDRAKLDQDVYVVVWPHGNLSPGTDDHLAAWAWELNKQSESLKKREWACWEFQRDLCSKEESLSAEKASIQRSLDECRERWQKIGDTEAERDDAIDETEKMKKWIEKHKERIVELRGEITKMDAEIRRLRRRASRKENSPKRGISETGRTISRCEDILL